MSWLNEKSWKVCWDLNYFLHFLFCVSTVGDCVSVSAFAALVGMLVGFASSAVGLNICAITEGIKKYYSIVKKRKKKHDKITLLTKNKLNTIKVLISKVLIDSYTNHDKFVSLNKVCREYNEMKEET